MENSSQGETDVENSFDSKMGGRFNMDIAEKINEIVKKRQEKIPQIIGGCGSGKHMSGNARKKS